MSCLFEAVRRSPVFKRARVHLPQMLSGMTVVDAASNKWRNKLSTSPCWRGTSQCSRLRETKWMSGKGTTLCLRYIKTRPHSSVIRGLHGHGLTNPNTNSLTRIIKRWRRGFSVGDNYSQEFNQSASIQYLMWMGINNIPWTFLVCFFV